MINSKNRQSVNCVEKTYIEIMAEISHFLAISR
nr:MAG TPA: hypothetical protein [Caudoviricetes sp.]